MPIRPKAASSEPPLRKRRKKHPTKMSKPEMKRAIDVIKRSGVDIGAIHFTPDGGLKVLTPSMVAAGSGNAFDDWEDRL